MRLFTQTANYIRASCARPPLLLINFLLSLYLSLFLLVSFSVSVCLSLSLRVLLGSDSNPTINIDDPVSDNFFNELWNKTARENTSTYERVSTRHTYVASMTT